MFIKLKIFHHIGDFSSKWWIFFNVINYHSGDDFSSNWWILIKVMDFHQSDKFFIKVMNFYQSNEYFIEAMLFIAVMTFYQSDKFSSTWWICILLMNSSNIMSIHQSNIPFLNHDTLFSLKLSICVKVININQSNEISSHWLQYIT